jgi:glucoamylase
LAAGEVAEAEHLMTAMEHMAGEGGLLPEQIWDADDIPERELYRGRPSGSATPLVWAHAEYLKLVRSLAEGRVFDMPPAARARYVDGQGGSAARVVWRFNHKITRVPLGHGLRIEVLAPAVVHWSADGWASTTDVATRDSGLGVHYVDLPVGDLAVGTVVRFTFRWPDADRWEGADFAVALASDDA